MKNTVVEDIMKVEKKFKYKDFNCVVTLSEYGWRCGYVILPVGHRLCGKDIYELYDLECHGGITYANRTHSCFSAEDGGWVIGFDYNHFGDNYDLAAVKILFGDKVFRDAKELFRNEIIVEGHRDGKDITLEDVENELKFLVDQL